MELKENECLLIIHDEINISFKNLNPGTRRKLANAAKYEVPGARFQPSVRMGRWDGKKSFCTIGGDTYLNLLDVYLPIVEADGYDIILDDRRQKHNITFPTFDENIFDGKVWPKGHPAEGQPIQLRDYQIEAVEHFVDNPQSVQELTVSFGKAQPLYSKILTPVGWKTMGDMIVGSKVLTPDGKTANVVGVYPQGKKKIYKVHFLDGRTADACGEHLWKIHSDKFRNNKTGKNDKLLTTDQIISHLDQNQKYSRPYRFYVPLTDFSEPETPKEVPIDPWLLGFLIGDGSFRHNDVGFSTKDDEMADKVQSILGDQYEVYKKPGDNCDYHIRWKSDYYILKGKRRKTVVKKARALRSELESLGLWGHKAEDKFIPDLYKTLSRSQTEQLLAGLVDSDGFIAGKSHISLSTSSERLMTDIKELVWKIGGTLNVKSRIPNYTYKGQIKEGKRSYTVNIRYKYPHRLVTLSRKLDRITKNYKYKDCLRLEITKIEEIGEHEAQCIMIDHPDHLYITDDYVVTHNTIFSAALSYVVEKSTVYLNDELIEKPRTIVVVPTKDLVNQTYNDYKNVGLDVGVFYGDKKDLGCQHTIVTWQSLNNLMKMGTVDGLNVIETFLTDVTAVIVDECHGAKMDSMNELLSGPFRNTPLRWGMTGTLPEFEYQKISVKILLGETVNEVTTKELQDAGFLSSCNINILQIQDVGEYKTYHDEVSFLSSNKRRLAKIADLIRDISKTGNTLVVFDRIVTGESLATLIPEMTFISGANKSKDRVAEYDRINNEDHAIVGATSGIVSTGINIPRIFNLVIIEPGKAFIKVIQTVGRGVRKAADKDHVEVWDITSSLKYSKRHLTKRKAFYKLKEFPHKVTKVSL